jgi:putative mycofactocin binding protein MftB
MTTSPPVVTILDETLALSPSVALRPEPFGALAYHFGNRRLTFLKRPELVSVVQGLDGSRSLADVLARCGVPERQWPVYAESVERLVESDMVVRPGGAS